MHGLMGVIVELVALGALVGCSAMQEQTKAPPPGCAEWVNDREGGYCGKTDEQADRERSNHLELMGG